MINNTLAGIRSELEQQSDPAVKTGAGRYFKEEIRVYGVKTAAVSRIAAAYYKEVKPLGKQQIFALCEELFRSGFMEESFIACEWSYRMRKEYVPGDFAVFENWVGKYVNNWAACDTLCNHTFGSFIEMYPAYIKNLKTWAKSDNRWFRRAAAVTLIVPAKEGKFLPDIFEIADILLMDKDDLVQKGYGWMLKEASKQHQTAVFEYVLKHSKVMPRTALRYAIEKMPEDIRKQAMGKACIRR